MSIITFLLGTKPRSYLSKLSYERNEHPASLAHAVEASFKTIVLFLSYQPQNQIPSISTDTFRSDDSAFSSSEGGPGKLDNPLFNIN